jgi:hypothetical protein
MIRDLPDVGPHIRIGIIVALDPAEDLLEECECFGRTLEIVRRERDIEAHAVDTYVDVKTVAANLKPTDLIWARRR